MLMYDGWYVSEIPGTMACASGIQYVPTTRAAGDIFNQDIYFVSSIPIVL